MDSIPKSELVYSYTGPQISGSVTARDPIFCCLGKRAFVLGSSGVIIIALSIIGYKGGLRKIFPSMYDQKFLLYSGLGIGSSVVAIAIWYATKYSSAEGILNMSYKPPTEAVLTNTKHIILPPQ